MTNTLETPPAMTVFTICCPKPLMVEVDRAAHACDLNRSQFIRHAVRAELARLDRRDPEPQAA